MKTTTLNPSERRKLDIALMLFRQVQTNCVSREHPAFPLFIKVFRSLETLLSTRDLSLDLYEELELIDDAETWQECAMCENERFEDKPLCSHHWHEHLIATGAHLTEADMTQIRVALRLVCEVDAGNSSVDEATSNFLFLMEDLIKHA